MLGASGWARSRARGSPTLRGRAPGDAPETAVPEGLCIYGIPCRLSLLTVTPRTRERDSRRSFSVDDGVHPREVRGRARVTLPETCCTAGTGLPARPRALR